MSESSYSRHELEVIGSMRRLLKARFILRSSSERWYLSILENREALQKALTPMGAVLNIQETLGVAHLATISEEAEEQINYQLGRKQKLGPITSLLILRLRSLRHEFFLNPTEDLTPLVKQADLREFTVQFSQSKIDSQLERNFRRALEELTELQVLRETQSGSMIYEITPICEMLLSVDQIQELKTKAQSYFSNFTVGQEIIDSKSEGLDA